MCFLEVSVPGGGDVLRSWGRGELGLFGEEQEQCGCSGRMEGRHGRRGGGRNCRGGILKGFQASVRVWILLQG